MTTDGPCPETSDLVAGWYMVDVESRERALEIAAFVSSGRCAAPRDLLVRSAAGLRAGGSRRPPAS